MEIQIEIAKTHVLRMVCSVGRCVMSVGMMDRIYQVYRHCMKKMELKRALFVWRAGAPRKNRSGWRWKIEKSGFSRVNNWKFTLFVYFNEYSMVFAPGVTPWMTSFSSIKLLIQSIAFVIAIWITLHPHTIPFSSFLRHFVHLAFESWLIPIC